MPDTRVSASPRIDWSLWAAMLAAALESLLKANEADLPAMRKYVEIQLREYEADISRALNAPERADNVVPIHARVAQQEERDVANVEAAGSTPAARFSIHDAIDEVLPR